MAETIGSLADKISIVQLKIFHMAEQLSRADADEEHKDAARRKLAVLQTQEHDLEAELSQLARDVAAGRVQLKIYRQYKMYNDPKYRIKQPGA